MLGSFADAEDLVQETLLRAWRARATYSADAPLLNWLMRIATNACLTHLDRRAPRHLPQFDRAAADRDAPFESLEASYWVTPAPDEALFRDPQETLEAREKVALAFIALLQRLPPSQRAVLILKDVVGWSADEIARTLDQTVSSVNSALHRARGSMCATPKQPAEDPPHEVLREYIRCWEEQDLQGLVSCLHADIVFAMPPFTNWFRGAGAIRGFLQSQQFVPFWSRGLAARETHANGRPALVWYTPRSDGVWRPHSIHVMQFEGPLLKEAINFIGGLYLAGFQMPAELLRDPVGS